MRLIELIDTDIERAGERWKERKNERREIMDSEEICVDLVDQCELTMSPRNSQNS